MFKLFRKEYSEEYKYLLKLLSKKNDWEYEPGWNNALKHKASGVIVVFAPKETVYTTNKCGNGIHVVRDSIRIIKINQVDEYSLNRCDLYFPYNKKEIKNLSKIILSYVQEKKVNPVTKILKDAYNQIS